MAVYIYFYKIKKLKYNLSYPTAIVCMFCKHTVKLEVLGGNVSYVIIIMI